MRLKLFGRDGHLLRGRQLHKQKGHQKEDGLAIPGGLGRVVVDEQNVSFEGSNEEEETRPKRQKKKKTKKRGKIPAQRPSH